MYDADGSRVAVITDSGDVTHYIAGIHTHDVAAGTEENSYTFGGVMVGLNDDGVRHHVFTDHLATVTATLEYGLGVANVERLRYSPYGDKRGSTGSVAGDRTYTGQVDDMTVTGLMFYNARYYDPVARNFVSPDTIIPDPASTLGWNRYSYVNNNPINYNDPTGRCVTALGFVIDGDASEACGGNPIAFMGGTLVGRANDKRRAETLEDASGRDVTAIRPGKFRPTEVAKPLELDANERLGNCHGFVFPNCHGADHDAADYRDQILDLAEQSPSGRVDIVAHSYSAFELSIALELYGDELKPVIGDVLLLGPTKVRIQGFDGVQVSVLYADFDLVRHTPIGPGRLGYAADATSPEDVDHPYFATPKSDNPIRYLSDQHDLWFFWQDMIDYLGSSVRDL